MRPLSSPKEGERSIEGAADTLKAGEEKPAESGRRWPRRKETDDRAVSHYASPEALFAREYASLSRALALVTGNLESAEDAVQEAFAELCKNWRKLSEYEDQAAWVRRVAINKAKDQKRSLSRRATALVRLEAEPRYSPQAQLPDTELHRALRRLPLKQRTAVALFYLADLSVAEVAEAMQVSEGTVKRHLDRGRETLRSTLKAGRDE